MKEKKNKAFYLPVDAEEVPDYYELIKDPMDLHTMLEKVDHGMYITQEDFMKDVDLIIKNAINYNPCNRKV